MQAFYNLKVRTKLTAGFMIIALLAGLMGGYAIFTVQSMIKAEKKLYEEVTLPLSRLSEISTTFQKINVDLGNAVVANDRGAIEESIEKVNANREKMRVLVVELEAFVHQEKTKNFYGQFVAQWNSFDKNLEEVIEVARENRDSEGRVHLSPDGMLGAILSHGQNLLKEMLSEQVAYAEQVNAANQTKAGATSIVMTILLLLVVCIAIGLGIFLGKVIGVPLKILIGAANKLAIGDIDVRIRQRSTDEMGELMGAFAKMLGNIKDQVHIAERIAEGDLSVEIVPKSEKDVQSDSMQFVVHTLQNLVDEADRLTKAAVAGELNTRGNTEEFAGGYKAIVEGVNATLDAVIGPLNVAAQYVDRISKGDIPEEITEEYQGGFNEIKDNLNTCIRAINALVEDASMLVDAAVDGKLNTRADTSRHGGDFAKIVEGVNQTLDAVIGPLRVAADYIDKIGNGEIPPIITETYYGDFNEIKRSINACIDGLGALVEGNDILTRMSNNDYSQTVKGEYQGIYQEIANAINIVYFRINEIIEALGNVSIGDFSDLQTMKNAGKQSENDKLVPVMIQLIESIKLLTEETEMLSQAAVEGRLDVRGDAGKFQGEYAKVIEGINATLDAVIEPIEEALSVLKEMANGNLQVSVQGDYKGDHAEIKNALNETLDNLLSYVSEISSVLSEIGNGNLNLAVTSDYRGDFVEIKDSLNNIIVTLNQVMGDINEAADQVASGSRQVSDGSQALSQGSTEQASAIQELTASITEIASQTRTNAANANDASQLAEAARGNAAKGNNQMQEMLKSMAAINESSANISKIIKVIDDIAFQTNILALNAAVEAARAGQHGKGFAVVAEEVRSLAARSAEAAKDTTELIEGSMGKVEAGTKIANNTAAALSEIVKGIERVNDLVADIAKASNEQATGIAFINTGIEQVSHVVQNNSATAEESAASSEELSGQAELLKEMVGRFRINAGVKNQPNGGIKRLSGEEFRLDSSDEPEPKILLSDDEFDKY